MMDDPSLKDDHGVPVVPTRELMFSSRAFVRFQEEMVCDLQRLVARWAHRAAPAAARRSFGPRKRKPEKPR
ncbi:MAG: hypothetical protein OES79_12300 [Planctomycetota bacterium]|nr:hypothetical protein [Planctomycetota bacterium]